MTKEAIYRNLQSTKVYDLQFDNTTETNKGFKISIQGKNIDDSVYLYMALHQFFYKNSIPFKVGTAKRIAVKSEQGNKLMTIYCPNTINVNELAEDIYSLTLNYKGWYDVKTPTSYQHYAGGLFIGNDRDNKGIYVPAKLRNVH